VGFVSKHVAQHFHANRPRPGPAVSAKLSDAAPTTAKRFSEHLAAASGALGQSRTSLLRRAVRAIELSWNLLVRSCKPNPLGADIVHVREDRHNGAGLAGRFGAPSGSVKMFDKNLIHVIIGGKDLDCGSAELSVNLVLTPGHGSTAPYSWTYNTSAANLWPFFTAMLLPRAEKFPLRVQAAWKGRRNPLFRVGFGRSLRQIYQTGPQSAGTSDRGYKAGLSCGFVTNSPRPETWT
jgi:hypothetical protein